MVVLNGLTFLAVNANNNANFMMINKKIKNRYRLFKTKFEIEMDNWSTFDISI